jgi:hypothetical protein
MLRKFRRHVTYANGAVLALDHTQDDRQAPRESKSLTGGTA